MKAVAYRWVLLIVSCTALACVSSSGIKDEENLDLCLMWGTSMDPLSYVATVESGLTERLAKTDVSAEIRSRLRKCLQNSEDAFISETTAFCETGSMNPDQFTEHSTDWTNKCIDEAFADTE